MVNLRSPDEKKLHWGKSSWITESNIRSQKKTQQSSASNRETAVPIKKNPTPTGLPAYFHIDPYWIERIESELEKFSELKGENRAAIGRCFQVL